MITKLRYIFIVVVMAVASALGALAQNASFTVRAQSQVIEGDRFTVTFRIVNADANIGRAQAPQLNNCRLLYGPGVSSMSSATYTNGRVESTEIREYTFTYLAEKAGTVTVPAMTIKDGSRTLTSKKVTITVLPPDKSAQRNQGRPAYSEDADGSGAPVSQAPAIDPKDLIVTVSMSKDHVYENEAVIATIRVYTKHDITSFRATTLPSFDGFLSEEIDVREQPHLVNFRGDNYYTVILKQSLLYPQKSGKLTINSGRYDVTLQTYELVSNGFFATRRPIQKNITTQSNSVTVNVTPLPEPRPAGFTNAVGTDFKVQSSLEPSLLRTNEAATYTLSVTGTGNIKYLTVPEIDFGPGVETFNPESESDAHFNGSSLTGNFTATYTIVPQNTGTLTVPASDFVYFNPSTARYVTVPVPAIERRVVKGSTAAMAPTPVAGGHEGLDDILYIKPLKDDHLYDEHHRTLYSAIYIICYLIVIGALVGSVIVYRRYVRLNADVAGRRMSRANSVAAKRLRQARACMTAHENSQFYDAVASALWGYVGDKLRLPSSALTRDNISQRMADAGYSPELIERTIRVLDECEMARFTPQHSDSEVQTLYDDTADVIKSLETAKRTMPTKNNPVRTAVITVALLAAGAVQDLAGPLAVAGDSAYAQKDYAAALDDYSRALQSEGSSSNLYYNLGNTCYRLGDLSHAIIYYERALKIDPSNADARTNLDFVKTKISGAPEDDTTFLTNIHNNIVAQLSPDAWAWMAFALFVVVCGAVALYIFAGSVLLRKTGFFGGIILLVIFVYVLVIAWSAARALDDHEEAVVTAPACNLRSEPTSQSSKTDKIVPVGQGTKLQVIDSVATPHDPAAAMWYEVRLSSGSRAWVNAADVERI